MQKFLQKILDVLTKPDLFFKKAKTEKEISKPLTYVAVLLLFNALVGALAITLNIDFPFARNLTYSGIVLFYVVGIVIAFLASCIFHLFAKLFGGKGKYIETLKAYCYGWTPTYLFGWVPYIDILATIYGIYLFVKGMSTLHNYSIKRAFLAWSIPVLILVAIAVILGAFIGVAIVSYLLGAISENI